MKVERVSREVRRRQVALARLHGQWVDKHLTDTPFDSEGRPDGSDYNQHHVDIEASARAEDEFHRRARRIMGLDDR